MIFALPVILLVVALCKSVTSNLTETAQANQDNIFNAVRTIRVPGVNSLMTVFGEQAFPIVVGHDVYKIPSPMGAGGTFGKARMVGCTLDAFIFGENPNNSPGGPTDQNRFLLNLYTWLAGGKLPKTAALIGGHDDRALEFLKTNNVKPTVIRLHELKEHKSLKDFDVVVIRDYITADHVPLFRDYINGGGGIAAVFHVVYWMSKVKIGGEFATNFPPNMLSKDFGFVWKDDEYITRSWIHYEHGILNVTYPSLAGATFLDLWHSVKATALRPESADQWRHFYGLFQANVRVLPRDLLPTMSRFYAEAVSFTGPDLQPVPSPQNPISSDSDKYKLLLFDYLIVHVLNPEDVPKHPSSDYFPGMVARNTTKTLVLWRNITFRKTIGTNHPTGLYAEAGKVVTVKLAEYTSREPPNIELQVGIGIGDISGRPEWKRPNMQPRLIRFHNRIATFSTPYGGAIYVECFDPIIPTSEYQKPKPPTSIKLVVSGAVSTPYFKLGETSIEEWQETIRKEPAPWTELVTDNIILTVPSADIRTLEDPDLLLDFWARATDAFADFAQVPHDRSIPIHVFFDVQLSYASNFYADEGKGFSHFLSTYSSHAVDLPYLMGLDSRYFFFNLAPHYSQDVFFVNRSKTSDSMFNLFGLYIYDKLAGLRPAQAMEQLTPPRYQPKIRDYMSTNLSWSYFLNETWLQLTFYMQLQEKYGWEIFQQTFIEYRKKGQEKPKDEDQITNFWVLLLSKSVERNLYDFHKSWGFPLSQNLSAQLSSLNYPMDPMRMEDLL